MKTVNLTFKQIFDLYDTKTQKLHCPICGHISSRDGNYSSKEYYIEQAKNAYNQSVMSSLPLQFTCERCDVIHITVLHADAIIAKRFR